MKKITKRSIAFISSVLLVFSLAGCSGGGGNPQSGTSSAPSTSASGETKTLVLSTHLSIDHSTMQMAQKFKEILQEKSGGSLDVEFQPDGVLGGQTDNCESLINGTVDMTIIDTGTLANYDPRGGILDKPYLFRDRDHAMKAATGEVGQDFMNMISETGIRPVSIQAIAFRNTLLKDKVITTPADFAGIKVRTPDNPSIAGCFSDLGATPVAIPSGEAYTAVQTGVVDGLEGNFEFIAQSKYYEVAKTMTLTEHIMTFTVMCISDKVYATLSSEQQTAINDAAAEAMDYFYDLYVGIEEDSRKVLEDGGVVINEVDKTPFIEACTPTLEKYVSDNGLDDLYEKIKAQ